MEEQALLIFQAMKNLSIKTKLWKPKKFFKCLNDIVFRYRMASDERFATLEP